MNIPKILKRSREVVKTANGKNIQISSYNRLTKKGVSKEKDITYRTKDEPRIKFIDKQVVRRDKDGNWKSEKLTKKLINDGKKIKSDVTYKTYKKGGATKSCWPGYEKKGSKTMYGKTYNNCVKK
jgi:hypothetical protein